MFVKPADELRSDVEVLEATRRGEVAAFDVFYRRHRTGVLAYCAQRVRAPEQAADLMAETFAAALLAVHDHARRLPKTPLAWLLTIAHHKLIDSYRRGRVEDESRRRLALEPLMLDDADIERINEIARTTDIAVELLSKLPADQRRALRARVLDERSYPEIARTLHCSEAVVRKRVSRGLATLRTAIGGT